MADHNEAANGRLRMIADILGVPVERLYDDTELTEFWATNECLRLWYQLKTNAGRDAALNALRRVLDDESA